MVQPTAYNWISDLDSETEDEQEVEKTTEDLNNQYNKLEDNLRMDQANLRSTYEDCKEEADEINEWTGSYSLYHRTHSSQEIPCY